MDTAPAQSLQSITTKRLSALKWNYIGRVTSLCLQFVNGIELGRMLGSESFDLVTGRRLFYDPIDEVPNLMQGIMQYE